MNAVYPSTSRSAADSPSRRPLGDLVDARAFLVVGEPQAGRHAGACGLFALCPTEDEVDRRQQIALGELLDRLHPARSGQLALPAPPRRPIVTAPAPESHGAGIEAQRVGVRAPVDDRRQQPQPVVGDVADVVEVVELHRSSLLEHDAGRTADRFDPLGELVGVAHRRRQAHQPDVGRKVDDHLLPHRAAIGVLQEVHLVEHHHVEV